MLSERASPTENVRAATPPEIGVKPKMTPMPEISVARTPSTAELEAFKSRLLAYCNEAARLLLACIQTRQKLNGQEPRWRLLERDEVTSHVWAGGSLIARESAGRSSTSGTRVRCRRTHRADLTEGQRTPGHCGRGNPGQSTCSSLSHDGRRPTHSLRRHERAPG